MNQFHIKILLPRSPLHVSGFGGAELAHPEQMVHSDTLTGALVNALIFGGGLPASSDAVLQFMQEVAVSGAFPCLLDEDTGKVWYFFPAPVGFFLSHDMRFRKKLKKIQWLEKGLFERVLCGDWEPFSVHLKEFEVHRREPEAHTVVFDGAFAWQGDCGLPHGLSPKQFVRYQENMRVQVPRGIRRDAQPFYQGAYCFLQRKSHRAGLYFLVDVSDERRLSQLDQALQVLKDQGLGSDRNTGLGHFTYLTPDPLAVRLPPTGEALVALGMYLPEDQHRLQVLQPLGYRLTLRGGWVSAPGYLNVRRNAVYMFSEGSVFRSTEPPGAYGGVRDVTPDHPVGMPRIWRSGRTLFFPMKSAMFL